MNDIEELKKQAEELKIKLDDVVNKIAKTEKDEFDALENYLNTAKNVGHSLDGTTISIIWKGPSFKYYNTVVERDSAELRRQSEYIIQKTIEYYNGIWEPNWIDKQEYKYFFYYDTELEDIVIFSTTDEMYFPEWVYMKSEEDAKKVKSILTNFHSTNVLGYWLTGKVI